MSILCRGSILRGSGANGSLPSCHGRPGLPPWRSPQRKQRSGTSSAGRRSRKKKTIDKETLDLSEGKKPCTITEEGVSPGNLARAHDCQGPGMLAYLRKGCRCVYAPHTHCFGAKERAIERAIVLLLLENIWSVPHRAAIRQLVLQKEDEEEEEKDTGTRVGTVQSSLACHNC